MTSAVDIEGSPMCPGGSRNTASFVVISGGFVVSFVRATLLMLPTRDRENFVVTFLLWSMPARGWMLPIGAREPPMHRRVPRQGAVVQWQGKDMPVLLSTETVAAMTRAMRPSGE